jgi:hypothetical protein
MYKRIGASESSSESGRVGRHVRCGELKKGLFGPGGGYKKREVTKTSLSCTQKDTSFRTRLIEELDILCRLAAKYKAEK